MLTVDLPGGTVNYRAAGPEGSTAPPVVFVHGFLVNGELWTGVADALGRHGVRSYAADWPLGSHPTAMKPTADQSPHGVAGTVISFLEALDLQDVTLVGNDTGGAICQLLIDTDHARVGRLVLTNCDAFDTFPPPPFDLLFKAGRSATRLRALLAPMRATAVRHSPAGFGMLVDKPLDPEVSRRWVEPCLTDEAVRRDTARFLKAVQPAELLDVSTRLGSFDKPVLLVWGAADRFFKVELARRLAQAFPDARLIEVPGGKTFLPLDEPDLLAHEITGFAGHRSGT